MATLDKLLLNADTNDEFIRQLMSSLVLSTRASNEVPSGSEFGYYATFPQFASLSDECAEGAAKLIKDLCDYVQPGKATNLPDDLLDPSLYSHIVDVIDKLLEKDRGMCIRRLKISSLISSGSSMTHNRPYRDLRLRSQSYISNW